MVFDKLDLLSPNLNPKQSGKFPDGPIDPTKAMQERRDLLPKAKEKLKD